MFERVIFRLSDLPVLMEVHFSFSDCVIRKDSTQILERAKSKEGTAIFEEGRLKCKNCDLLESTLRLSYDVDR